MRQGTQESSSSDSLLEVEFMELFKKRGHVEGIQDKLVRLESKLKLLREYERTGRFDIARGLFAASSICGCVIYLVLGCLNFQRLSSSAAFFLCPISIVLGAFPVFQKNHQDRYIIAAYNQLVHIKNNYVRHTGNMVLPSLMHNEPQLTYKTSKIVIVLCLSMALLCKLPLLGAQRPWVFAASYSSLYLTNYIAKWSVGQGREAMRNASGQEDGECLLHLLWGKADPNETLESSMEAGQFPALLYN